MKINSTLRFFSGTSLESYSSTSAARSSICLSMGVIALFSLQHTQARTSTWEGDHGSSLLWSQKQNWNGAGGGIAPVTGDDLIFTGSLLLTTNNNDLLAATSFNSLTFNASAGAFRLNGNSITLAGNVVNSSTSVQTINLGLILSGATRTFDAANGNLVVSGSGTISGGFGVDKIGSNALTLATANTYSGTTTITNGTLFANNASGSATGTGAVSVAGTLGGNGIIAPTGTNGISVSGELAPGAALNTIGTLTLNMAGTTGTVAINGGANISLQLGIAGGSIGSVGVSDLLSLASASANDFAFNNNSVNFLNTGAVGFYKLFDTSLDATTWNGLTFISDTGLVTGGLAYTGLTNGLTGNFLVGTSSNGGNSGDIYFQVVPEPGAALLGGWGMLLLLRRRRA